MYIKLNSQTIEDRILYPSRWRWDITLTSENIDIIPISQASIGTTLSYLDKKSFTLKTFGLYNDLDLTSQKFYYGFNSTESWNRRTFKLEEHLVCMKILKG